MAGGYSKFQDANDECREIVKKIQGQVESKLNNTFSTFQAKSFSSQIVAGKNWKINVDIGGKEIQITVFEDLPCNSKDLELTDVTLQ